MKRWALNVAGVTLALALAAPRVSLADDHPTWTQPQAPFRIVGNIYYVGSRGLAAYLITSPEGHILIDGTVAENAPLIEANIKALGFQLRDVKILLNNHAHHDHAGALAQLKKDTGAQLLASPGDVWALEHGRPRGDNPVSQTPWPPAKVDRLLRDGEIVRLGPIALNTLFTPGHTPGCTSWTMELRERDASYHVLFLCSITVAGNVLVGNKAYPAIATDYRKSLERLQSYNGAEVVLTGHPEVADVIGRHESQLMGDPDPWSDSGQLSYMLDSARAELDQGLGKPHRTSAPIAKSKGSVWRDLVRPEDHFTAQFPGAPMMVRSRYDLGGHTSVPAQTYTAEWNKAAYRLTVADISGQTFDREAVIRTAIGRLVGDGKLRTYAEARIRLAHGRQISVERTDGGRSVASVFIAGNRLYELEGRAPGQDSAPLLRFQQMLNID